jgi:hypothetical protein
MSENVSKNQDNTLKSNIVSIIGLIGICSGMLALSFIFWEKISTQGERISRLEGIVDKCVQCGVSLPQKFEKDGVEWTRYKGQEPNGSFAVEIDVISDKYRWLCNKSGINDIEQDNLIFDSKKSLSEIISKYEPNKELDGAKEIIVIGTASFEGDINTQTQLADRRAYTLKDTVAKGLGEILKIPVLPMSFGQYYSPDASKGKCSNATSEQRRILIVKVTKQPEGIKEEDLEKSLVKRFEELAKDPSLNFPVDIRDYSNYRDRNPMLLKPQP